MTKRKLLSKKDLVDPQELLNQAILSGLEAGYSDIDDRDVPRAPNAVEWMIGARFLNVKPFAKQLQDILHFFTAACYYCSDTEYLVDIPIDAAIGDIRARAQLMKFGKCPKCKRKEQEMRYEWCLDPANMFNGFIKPDPPNELCCVKGQRSGKSVQTAMIATYVTHRYLKLPNPSRWFRLLKRQVLHTTFVSVTATQAWENLWQPYSDFIDSSPWYKTYHDFLTQEGERLGCDLWAKKDTYLWYGHKRLAQTFAPSDVRTLRGRTRVLSAIDEWGWFGSSKKGHEKVKADGDGTHRALDRSLATIRNAANRKRRSHQSTPDGYMITISSPSAATDPIMRRHHKAPKSPRVYSILQATWEANPNFTEDSLRAQEGDVTESEFQCDYGCRPPYSSDPWWDSLDHLKGLCRRSDPKEHKLWTMSIQMENDPLGAKAKWIWAKLNITGADRQTPRILCLDTGEKNNSFSWCMAHYNKYEDMVIIDDVGEIAPDEGHRIHFGNMWAHCVLPLVQNFRFLHIVWDHWESSTYVSDLRTKWKVRAEQYTCVRKDAKQLRSDMLNSLISFPIPETAIEDLPPADSVVCARYPRTHLLLQMMTVREIGGVPLKPQGGQDDTFRTVLLSNTYIRENIQDYSFYSRWGGRFVGMSSSGRGRGGVISGAGGVGIAVGPRRK